jgi:hypothetical protein
MKSIIKLFKAVPIEHKNTRTNSKVNKWNKRTIEYGFLFSPSVINHYSEDVLEVILKECKSLYGISGEQANSSFHKSWNKVKNASDMQLFIEQILHYITTYGYDELGIYNKDTVYIPSEELDVPNIDEDKIKLVIIKGITNDELKQKLITLLQSGIALKDDTKNAVVDVALYLDIKQDDIKKINNKEVRITLYDFLDEIPEEPIEFLRYLVYKATESSLLIKDSKTIETIKNRENFDILALVHRYKNKYGLKRLAEIFFRFKPIFLAFKTNSQLNHYINRIRKLADKYHKPMPRDYLNDVTGMIKNGIPIVVPELKKHLRKANTFRKIRLAYALHYRTKDDLRSIAYRIRNGKTYTTEFDFEDKDYAKDILEVVLRDIRQSVSKNVYGKKIYIPDNIVYALPSTEKQFTGNIPTGTYIKTDKDMIAGVHWTNTENSRVDLDLSLLSITGKLGWDSSYRNTERTTMFSGDITDAPKPNGASELYYISGKQEKVYLMMLNYYNYPWVEDKDVSYKIMIGQDNPLVMDKNYTLNQNNILAITQSNIDKQQTAIGLVVVDDDGCKFYFNEMNIGRSITSSLNENTKNLRQYLIDYYTNMISLNDILWESGAIPVDNPEDADIDLSPENVDKEMIIGLLN